MTVPLKPYSIRCRHHYNELIKQGHNPRDKHFKHLLAQRLRLFGLHTEIITDLTGRRVEVWRETQEKVEF